MSTPYTTRAEIEAELPPREILRALDDNADGVEDTGLFNQLLANAAADVDAILGQRYEVPFTSDVPPIVVRASRLLVLAKLYARRGVEFPQAKELEAVLAKLDRIANGEEPLAPEAQRANGSVSIIVEDSRVHSESGGIL